MASIASIWTGFWNNSVRDDSVQSPIDTATITPEPPSVVDPVLPPVTPVEAAVVDVPDVVERPLILYRSGNHNDPMDWCYHPSTDNDPANMPTHEDFLDSVSRSGKKLRLRDTAGTKKLILDPQTGVYMPYGGCRVSMSNGGGARQKVVVTVDGPKSGRVVYNNLVVTWIARTGDGMKGFDIEATWMLNDGKTPVESVGKGGCQVITVE